MTETNLRVWPSSAAVLLCAFLLSSPCWAGEKPDAAKTARNEAAALSHVAHGKATEGKWRAAGDMYMQAWKTDSTVLGYLASAATSFYKAGAWQPAKAAYKLLLERLPAGDKRAAKATKRLAECQAKIAATRADAERAAESKRREKAEEQARMARIRQENESLKAARREAEADAQHHREVAARSAQVAKQRASAGATSALLVGGLGAISLGAAGYLVWAGADEASTLEADLQKRDSNGKVIGLDYDDALSRQDGANLQLRIGVGLGVAGASALAWGLWRYLQAPTSVSLAPTLGGAELRVRF